MERMNLRYIVSIYVKITMYLSPLTTIICKKIL
jgi:hypothetical protein